MTVQADEQAFESPSYIWPRQTLFIATNRKLVSTLGKFKRGFRPFSISNGSTSHGEFLRSRSGTEGWPGLTR